MDELCTCNPGNGMSKQFTTFDLKSGNKTVFIDAGASKVLIDSDETGIITRTWFTFPGWFWRHWDPGAIVDPAILRLVILKIYFDGYSKPSIEAPLGDFFGIGHCEYRHFTSKFIGMSSGGFYSYLPMPFEKGFALEIENRHPTIDVEIFYNINYQALDRLDENTGRLHCSFNCGYNSGSEPLEILDVKGEGHFVGCCLSLQGKEPNYLAYLEAPEYIYIDSEKDNPAIVGTGMEDYFNGGWYFRNGEFYSDYHGVPLKDPFRSMISMYRFHEKDAITFKNCIRFAFINPWASERLKPFLFSSTAYYYLNKAQKSCYDIPDNYMLLRLYRIRDVDFQSIP